MTTNSTNEPSAKVRGDDCFELAQKQLLAEDLFAARETASQAVAFMRMFYGKNSPQVNEALDLAKRIQEQIVLKNPSLAPRRRSSKKK
ncbi:MAG: hypothetical protein C0507_16950 [Cyanobacteria bacterium PR.3.49]|nr:hypothetical protein [Cyanobacteria bacterium PR.3.49]